MMVEVRLHGELARQFGRAFHFDISTPREAIQALGANFPEFTNALRNLTEKGARFRVRTKSQDYSAETVDMRLGAQGRIDIIPIVTGASAGLRFIAGAVMIGLSVFGGVTGLLGQALFTGGVGLALGSVVEWLTPKAAQPDRSQGLQSWTMGGPSNDGGPGSAVPIIFGEVLVGGIPISGSLSSSPLPSKSSLEPAAVVGGLMEVAATFPGAPVGVVVVEFHASTLNMLEPFTYLWTLTPLSPFDFTLEGATSQFLKATITKPFGGTSAWDLLATLSVQITGKDARDGTTVVTRTASPQIRIAADNKAYLGGL